MITLTLFLILLDTALLTLGAYNLYWQAQIDVRGNYASFQVIMAAMFAVWFMATGAANLLMIIFFAAFITLTVMSGNSGLTPNAVVSVGMVRRVLPYAKMTAISLTPLALPNGRELVVAVFGRTPRGLIRLTFKTDLQTLMTTLRPRVPDSIPITIQKVQ
ncbi:hypothetical protein [Lacticaseibacillus daqingensis]|uniref:hypothetical protein n=1 Tax=Lacticaseibacillus daqingensis TaxID=2486014 RepID=UPI0013DE1609|nr:hypothetical protein [Lacticaseibacillus daqingensis]